MNHHHKKINIELIFIILLVTFSLGNIIQAKGLVPCGGPEEEECTACHLLVLVQNVVDFVIKGAIFICIVLIIYGGFRWLFSFGKQENIVAGQKAILNAIIGLVIVLVAWLIVNTIFWLIAYVGGENYTGSWWHLECQ